MLLALLTTFAVLQPDGWIEGGRPAIRIPLPVRAFHAPDDAATIYAVGQGDGRGIQVTGLADSVVEGTVVSRTQHVDKGRTIDERISDLPNGLRMHVRVVYGAVGSKTDVVVGVCVGRDKRLAECEARLGELQVQVDPDVDTSGFIRLLLGLLAGALGLALALFVIARALRNRELRKSPPIVDGEEVTIAGVVRAVGQPLEAPLSGRPCVAHRSRARVFDKEQVIAEPAEHGETAFEVETKHGVVRVDDKPTLECAPESVVDTTDRTRAFRERHNITGTVQLDEIVVHVGAKVMIRGVVRVDADVASKAERGYRDNAPAIKRLATPVVLRVW